MMIVLLWIAFLGFSYGLISLAAVWLGLGHEAFWMRLARTYFPCLALMVGVLVCVGSKIDRASFIVAVAVPLGSHLAGIALPLLLLRENLRLSSGDGSVVPTQMSIWLLLRWTLYSALLAVCVRQCTTTESGDPGMAGFFLVVQTCVFFAGLLASVMVIPLVHSIAKRKIAKRNLEPALAVLGMGLAIVCLTAISDQTGMFIGVALFLVFWLATLYLGLRALLAFTGLDFWVELKMTCGEEQP